MQRTTQGRRVLGKNIRAAIIAVYATVMQWHTGQLVSPTIPVKTPKSQTRYTPSFCNGKGPEDFRSVPYTAKSISELLRLQTQQDVHPIVLLALLLLEAKEKELLAAEHINALCNDDFCSVKGLLNEVRDILQKKRKK